MYIDFSGLFHSSSKDLTGGGTVNIPWDETLWPEEWYTVNYKTYPRYATIPLPEARPIGDFFSLVSARCTDRSFSPGKLSPESLSTLLKYSCGITQERLDWNPRRAQPSAGALYPIEVYPILFSDAGSIPSGIYHYNVKKHGLDAILQRRFTGEDIGSLTPYPFVQHSSALVVMTSVFWRNQTKYGERGYRYILLEAGHIGQNVYLTSAALGLNCSGLGGTLDTNIEKLLGVDGIEESLVYSLVIG